MSYLPYSDGGLGSWIAATGSSALVHAGVIALGLGGMQQFFEATEAAQPSPDYTITLEQLDSEALAGITEQLGIAGAEGVVPEGLDGIDGEALENSDAETLAALEPEPVSPSTDALEPETPEVETLDALPEEESLEALPESEVVEPLPETETVEPLPEPETIEPLPELETVEALPETETLEALPEPETITADVGATADALEAVSPTAPASAPLSPVAIEAGTATPETVTAIRPGSSLSPGLPAIRPVEPGTQIAGRAVTPVQPATTTLAQVTPRAPTPQAVEPTRPAPQTITAARPTAAPNPVSARPAAPPPSAQDLAVADLIRRIRTAAADPCLLALPRRDGADGVGLALIAATDGSMANFSETVLTEDDQDIRQTRSLIDPRQCPALTYVRQNDDYPAMRLGIRLETAEVTSGSNLRGRLRGTGGRYLLLLLVDNNGVVQDLQRFVTFSGNTASFDIPVTRVGAARDTKQVLLAIAARTPLRTLRERDGQLAQDFFAGQDSDSAITVVTFDVR